MTRLYLISGFLGAGKTTLVKRLLALDAQAKVGVIMNEFGKVSIDGPILQKNHMEMIELTRGSIFCSCLTMAFAEALIEMATKDLDYLIVESSGLADPSNIGEILKGVSQQLESPYIYSGSITVVDAHQFLSDIGDLETITKQIECADLTFVNKVDLVSEEIIQKIRDKIYEINQETDIKLSRFFEGVQSVFGQDLSKGKYPALKASYNTPENKPKTMSLTYTDQVPKVILEAFIASIMASAFRVKGFVQADDQWWEVHGVGSCIDFYETDRHFELSTLVVISKIGPQIIRDVDVKWKAVVGVPMKMGNG